ncbi:two-component system, NtrC family, C4-dicarboxylate transport sensor histidine kinase DctB [Vibrio crassostreae]|uniref:sensor histidine kinase n=1 Tax=Vibrio crassostreae TaxID=246167 RepID=UPI001B30C659|nr:two-component system, NtrC family, C4-dicarboxylate transport sensor histidine kinase DctB [Vibrio crassostreae]CAK1961805.1 two-component system, NtrC family, C4-dicarboxylate transport sensor histidine kinase DctB [Vibrio crassostreae]CAK1967418.1 two-component system, NtrC family, C4-dicarboxylate transport sensor histidine kinase DctB [Vibrio crassostreae]CAK1985004.1 two-component system, NtrC family, C4-dicarboxylate transport sensor histidine kinase DctB [Vibrio crassostreae]CAK198512
MTKILPNLMTPFVLFSLLLGAAGLTATHFMAVQFQEKIVTQQLNEAANKANLQIDSELDKFKQIPNLLSHDPRLLSYFDSSPQTDKISAAQLNQLLFEWSNQSQADTIYIHDPSGTVVASSNYQKPRTFVGENFSFRPYFASAIQGNNTHYVALGARSNVRGYFLSSPLYVENDIVGVITVKVSLENLENILTSDEFEIVVLDSNQVVFLSSQAPWLYHSLLPLTQQQQTDIAIQRQYGQSEISIIEAFRSSSSQPEANANRSNNLQSNQIQKELTANQLFKLGTFNLYPAAVSNNQYQVVALKETRAELIKVLQIDVIFVVIYSLVMLIAWSWRQTYVAKVALTRLNQNLEQTVDKRTHYLKQSNQQLQQTIFQYQESQLKLKQTEQELTQTAKLAVLGELSASINHEINQPLAALRTYSENSLKLLEMERTDLVKSNLEKMIGLNNTITDIIARLKVFTRKVTKQEHHVANLHQAVNNATSILSALMIKQGITLRLSTVPDDINIAIHPTELEQVLVNLIHNATQALQQQAIDQQTLLQQTAAQQAIPQIGVEWQLHEDMCQVIIWDNGIGMSADKLEQLFDPFFTTKPEGLGLGLSISKRIIEAYHGSISAAQLEPSGMVFSLNIPLYKVND